MLRTSHIWQVDNKQTVSNDKLLIKLHNLFTLASKYSSLKNFFFSRISQSDFVNKSTQILEILINLYAMLLNILKPYNDLQISNI